MSGKLRGSESLSTHPGRHVEYQHDTLRQTQGEGTEHDLVFCESAERAKSGAGET